MTSNAVQRPQIPGALRVAAAWARLRCSASSTMSRHRLDRRPLHPGPRRSQRDPRDFCHGLLACISHHPSTASASPSPERSEEIIRPDCVALRQPPRRTARVRLRGPRSRALSAEGQPAALQFGPRNKETLVGSVVPSLRDGKMAANGVAAYIGLFLVRPALPPLDTNVLTRVSS